MTTYFKITINGTTFSDNVDCTLRKSIGENNSVSYFDATFDNFVGEHNTDFSINDTVEIFADTDVNPPTTKRFAGIITDIEYSGKPNNEMLTIRGKDYSIRLIDATIEPIVYNNTEVSEIITDLISRFVPGITTTNVSVTTTTINHKSYNHISVFDAIKDLAEQVGYTFWVDENADLHFMKSGTVSSGKTIDNTNILESRFTTNDFEIYNKVWVYGDRQLSKWRNQFTANGGSVYTLDYNPHNTEVYISGNDIPKKGGVFELVEFAPSGLQYLVDYDQKNIIFVSGTNNGNNIPTSGTQNIIVKFDRSTPIIKYAEDKASIALYGPKPKVINDKSIVNPNQAKDLVLTTIREHGSPQIYGECELLGLLDLTPGNSIVVNLPFENINNQVYNILEVIYTFSKKENFSERNIRIKLNKRLVDLIDTVKEMLLAIRNLQAQDLKATDVLSRLEYSTGSVGVRVKSWAIKSAAIGSDFYVGSPASPNGWAGSPGSYYIGSHSITQTTLLSGGDV